MYYLHILIKMDPNNNYNNLQILIDAKKKNIIEYINKSLNNLKSDDNTNDLINCDIIDKYYKNLLKFNEFKNYVYNLNNCEKKFKVNNLNYNFSYENSVEYFHNILKSSRVYIYDIKSNSLKKDSLNFDNLKFITGRVYKDIWLIFDNYLNLSITLYDSDKDKTTTYYLENYNIEIPITCFYFLTLNVYSDEFNQFLVNINKEINSNNKLNKQLLIIFSNFINKFKKVNQNTRANSYKYINSYAFFCSKILKLKNLLCDLMFLEDNYSDDYTKQINSLENEKVLKDAAIIIKKNKNKKLNDKFLQLEKINKMYIENNNFLKKKCDNLKNLHNKNIYFKRSICVFYIFTIIFFSFLFLLSYNINYTNYFYNIEGILDKSYSSLTNKIIEIYNYNYSHILNNYTYYDDEFGFL